MEVGFLPEQGADATTRPSEWVSGLPEHSWLTGTRLRGKVRAPLTALRCGECGLVKLYALDPEAAAAAHSALSARVDQLEVELARLAEREQFLMKLLEGREALPAEGRRQPDALDDV
jgi:hypothetical protein